MYGHLMYEIAKQRIADQQRAAQQARVAHEARARRTAARRERAGQETIAAPVIPDFAHEMFDVTREAIPAPRQQDAGGRRARSSR